MVYCILFIWSDIGSVHRAFSRHTLRDSTLDDEYIPFSFIKAKKIQLIAGTCLQKLVSPISIVPS